jgi:uroporphyrinogen-III synthase
MRVIVTRPEPEAGRWAQALRARGIDALALPLIDILPMPDAQPLRDAWRALGTCKAAMFVSGNAVHGFFAARPTDAAFAGSRAWATGPGTQQALLAHGVVSGAIDVPSGDSAQFDSESLWALVHGQLAPGDRVLIVRGADAQGQTAGRDWLAQRLRESGAQVDVVCAYRRAVPRWSAEQQGAARQAAAAGAQWLFSSSEAVANLAQLLPGQGWSRASALATHPRIAEAAQSLGFAEVRLVRPSLDAVVASIESAR